MLTPSEMEQSATDRSKPNNANRGKRCIEDRGKTYSTDRGKNKGGKWVKQQKETTSQPMAAPRETDDITEPGNKIPPEPHVQSQSEGLMKVHN